MKDYKKIIRDLREDNDLKQKQIAKVVNTTQSNYSKYERGERALTIEQLIELCKFYNVSADYILGFEKNLPWYQNGERKNYENNSIYNSSDNGNCNYTVKKEKQYLYYTTKRTE